MTTVIGKPSTLALEYCIADASMMMGYSLFWLGNASLDSIEELDYLDGYVMGCLQDLRQKALCMRVTNTCKGLRFFMRSMMINA